MRSNVVDVNRSPAHRPSRMELRNPTPGSMPVFQPQAPYPQRPPVAQRKSGPPPAKRRLTLVPTEGWLALLLLAIALYSVVLAIIAAQWVKPGPLLLWSPLTGLLVGFVIAKIPRFPQAVLHLGACLIGYWQAVWLTSALAYHIPWTWLLTGLRAAFTGTLSSSMPAGSDTIFFFYLCFLCFFLAYFGSWLIYRAHLPWLVALVYSSIMLVNLNYVKNTSFSIVLLVALMAGSLALLVARMQVINQVLQWKREGLHTDRAWLRSITWRCMQVASVITLITLLLGLALPNPGQPQSGRIFWDRMDNIWNNLANGRFSWQDVGALAAPYTPSSNYFGDQLTITGSVTLPMGEVLYYSNTSGPHYLEGFTYNHFDGHTWITALPKNTSTRYAANAPLPVDANNDGHNQVTTTVTLVEPPQGTKPYLFGPAQPISFDVPTTVYSDGTTAGAWTQQSPLVKGQHYRVTSLQPTTNAQTLSAIPLPTTSAALWQQDAYYNDLRAYYLQVPNDLSPRVRQLATQWTQGSTSAYGALKMLESHLSDQHQFTYAVQNPPIPSNVDVVDWLLQTRRGYCTSYASAMAVMARQLGIPTRITNGFSNGQFDAQRKLWSVQGSDAHSWVQAYFPGYGWINFDPTPGFAPNAAPTPQSAAPAQPSPTAAAKAGTTPTPPPAKTKTATNKPNPPQPALSTPGLQGGGNGTGPGLLMGLSIGVFLLSLLLFLYALTRYWWRNLYAHSSFISGVYWRFCRIASWLGLAPRQWQTPYEYSHMLIRHFPQQATPLWRLTELFVRDRYGAPYQAPRPQDAEAVERLQPTLRSLLLHLLLRKVKKT